MRKAMRVILVVFVVAVAGLAQTSAEKPAEKKSPNAERSSAPRAVGSGAVVVIAAAAAARRRREKRKAAEKAAKEEQG